MRSLLALALVLSATPAFAKKHTAAPKFAKPAKQAKTKVHRTSLPGGPQVVYVTAKTAYLGLGADDGLQVGMNLPLKRGGRAVSSCQVTTVSPHSATCAAQGTPKLGDAFSPPEPPAKQAKTITTPLPPMPTGAQLAQEKAALAPNHFEKVAFESKASGLNALAGHHLHSELSLTEAYFSTNDPSSSRYFVQTVTAAARDAELGAGFHASIDLTVQSYFQRPSTFRFPETASNQLFVRELAISYHPLTSHLAFSLGRIWSQAPGVGVLDGAQASWHSLDHTLEAGLLGGTDPNAVTTAPTTNPLVGAFVTGTWPSASGSWFQADGVMMAREVPGAGFHLSLDGLALWSIGKGFDTSAELRVGSGVVQAPDLIDLATFSVNARPTDHAQVWASVRYEDSAIDQLLHPELADFTDASLHAQGAASYLFDTVSITGLASFSRDLDSGLHRTVVGTELSMPRMLGTFGGMSVGYDENFGWMAGRDAYVEAAMLPGQTVQLRVRASYFYAWAPAINTDAAENGVGALVETRFRLNGWLSLQTLIATQVSITPTSDTVLIPLGTTAAANATARF
ncbi:MAG: hypothetical protein JST54_01500 [Deltaproteobacteria bacterium]|nr:hypothetical protein [Deltaproteobacteria bacterium]